MTKTSHQDQALIDEARKIIRLRYKKDVHQVGSALRTKSGKIFTGVHLEGYIGRVAVCAEAIALGNAATAGDTEIETIVAVSEDGQVLSPCGICRELISDFSADAKVIVNGESGPEVMTIDKLLPLKYTR